MHLGVKILSILREKEEKMALGDEIYAREEEKIKKEVFKKMQEREKNVLIKLSKRIDAQDVWYTNDLKSLILDIVLEEM